MRKTMLLALALPMILVGGVHACTVSGAYFSGQFDDSGQFVLESAMSSSGRAIDGVAGMVFKDVAMGDDVAMPTAAGQTLYAHGDLDFDNAALSVKGFTTSPDEAAATVAKVQGASYASAGASGCSAAKAASASAGSGCASKAATAATASSGSGCASKAAAASAGSGCGSKAATAATASSGSGCGSAATAATAATASTAGAKTASASGCCPSAASAKNVSAQTAATSGAAPTAVVAGSGCSSTAAAKTAETASEKSGCGPDCVKACCAAYAYTYSVTGMTCGGCASKVEKAVMKYDEKDVAAVVVDYKAGTAVVTSKEEMDAEQLAKAISATGFEAELVEDEAETEKSEKKEKAPPSDEEPTATM